MNSALVVGEGIAGLATAVELLELGAPVVLLAREPVEHAESTHRHDGVEAALGDDDDPARHADDLVALAGEAARPFLQAMTQAAPALVERLERLDVPFERTRKGELARVMLTGSSRARSHHAGALTARHVSRRLAALALRHEALERHVGWSVVDLVLDDDGVARGVVAQCFATGEHRAFAADGVCFAGGGHAGLFHADTLAPPGLGGLTGLALRHGAELMAPERVSLHPLSYRAGGFVRRLPRRLLAMGASIDAGLLDLSSLDRGPLRVAAGSALEAHARATGADAYAEPVVVFSAPDRTLGGLGISADHATSVPGLFAVGGAVGAYFGAGTTPSAPLTAALFGAERAARAIERHRQGAGESAGLDARLKAAEKRAEQRTRELLGRDGEGETVNEVARDLRRALGRQLEERDGAGLARELDALEARARRARLGDPSPRANAALRLAWDLEPALLLAREIAKSGV